MKFFLVLLLLTLSPIAAFAVPVKPITLDASAGQLLGGVTLATARSGYTGTGYATGFTGTQAAVRWTLAHAAPGLYEVRVRFSSPNGQKGYNLVVNGHTASGMFPATGNLWATTDAGKVNLTAGTNTVAVQKGWGYYDIASVTLVPTLPYPLPRPVSGKLSDPQAMPQARALMRYLVSLYGRKTISGQYDQAEADYVHQISGRTPAILGGDLIEYSPSRLAHGSDSKNETERMIAAARAGHIVTMSWHWNAPKDLLNTSTQPWWKGFYTSATTFNLQYALDHPQSEDYRLLLSNMDSIAVQLRKFQTAGIPVLWRPLHEAEGGWFWWGAKGPESFKRLWRLMYRRFTTVDHLHNLIWVDCSGNNPAWYPGDQYVDIIGIDAYPDDVADPLGQTWATLQKEYGGRKLVVLTEFGGVPDVARMFSFGVRWSYFVSWTGNVGPRKITPAALTRIYQSQQVVNLDHLPQRHGW